MFKTHPVEHLMSISSLYNVKLEFEFSEYKYQAQTVLDERRCFKLSSDDLNYSWFMKSIDSLEPDYELAIHSCVKVGKKKSHIPQIDFCCKEHEIEYAIGCLRKVLPREIYLGLNFYNSGRSFHAYGSKLLTHKEWINFMGRLLLANYPDQNQVIDTRWIGHRLIGGYGSLRLSNNSKNYLSLPTRMNINKVVK